MSRARRAAVSLSSEQGSLLVEVMVGALVLAIATFAIMSGLDGAQSTALTNKERSTAATLAQQDLERLRSFPITSLSNYEQTRTVKVGGVNYTVTTKTEWIRDTSGIINCTDDTSQADYLKLSSTVKSPAQTTPVTEVGLLTPGAGAFGANLGTLVVKVTSRDGLPVQNASVSLSGTGAYSESTNAEGCAIFAFIPSGTYDIDVPGRVGPGGVDALADEATVVGTKTSLKELQRENPGAITANFLKPDGTATSWNELTVVNASLPGGSKEYTVATPATSMTVPGLFPFADGYGVFAGTCQRNNPLSWDANYYTTSGGKGFANFAPGASATTNVEMGKLTVIVQTTAGTTPINPARVTVRQADTGNSCNTGLLVAINSAVNGTVEFILPMGTYNVCASGPQSGTTGTTRFVQSTTPINANSTTSHPRLIPGATTLTQTRTMKIPTSGSSGSCSNATDTSP
jgi:Tfp pilus assembly protein PilV